ncbi:MAG: hypothetical protein JRD43_04565 [Deltaproteobacteria bacterium]|nr:hypothetical protein [Deltaproteobacteria bacterium]MBW2594496.1 hypothetical protein [Deltaproteobacteria bacterium]
MDSIETIKREDTRIVSLFAHDSSDWSVVRFKEAFGDRYRDPKVGENRYLGVALTISASSLAA